MRPLAVLPKNTAIEVRPIIIALIEGGAARP